MDYSWVRLVTRKKINAENSQKTEGNLLLNIPRHRLW